MRAYGPQQTQFWLAPRIRRVEHTPPFYPTFTPSGKPKPDWKRYRHPVCYRKPRAHNTPQSTWIRVLWPKKGEELEKENGKKPVL